MAAPRRRALGTLFLLLAVFFAGIAVTAASGGADASRWAIAIAAAAISLWLASLAVGALRHRVR